MLMEGLIEHKSVFRLTGQDLWTRTNVCEVAEHASAEEDDGGSEGPVAVEHLLPLFGEEGGGGEQEGGDCVEGGGEGFSFIRNVNTESDFVFKVAGVPLTKAVEAVPRIWAARRPIPTAEVSVIVACRLRAMVNGKLCEWDVLKNAERKWKTILIRTSDRIDPDLHAYAPQERDGQVSFFSETISVSHTCT